MYETIEEYFEKLHYLPVCEKKQKWEEVFLSMATHTRKRIPKDTLLKRRPNEEEHILNYRIANFRAITYGSMNKALDDCYRIVSGISYTVSAPENVKDFLNNNVIVDYTISGQNEVINTKLFIEKMCLKRGIEDPNGFLIWLPGGEGITDSSQKVIPQPRLVLSSQFVYADKNVFIYKSEEKSPLYDKEDNIVMEGEIYFFITREEIWTMYQIGTVSDPQWEQEMVYRHDMGAFPIIVFGGDMNQEGYYDSYFSPYLAFGDEAIVQFSDWQATMVTSSFPTIEEFANECYIREVNKDNKPTDNEENFSGGGNGNSELKPMHRGPYGIIYRKIPIANLNDDTLPVEIASRRYIAPPIEVAKEAKESWKDMIDLAEKALNIDQMVGVDQSGKAKLLDKEGQYSMITKIGTNFFDNIYLNSLKIIDCYLNRGKFSKSGCVIGKPTTFWVKNELDLIQEITTLKAGNAPSFFLAEATVDLGKKRFSGNPVNERILKFISMYDPCFVKTDSEKNMMLASGVIDKEIFIRSLYMFPILNQMVEELSREKFMEMSFADIEEEFSNRVDEFLPEEPQINVDNNGNPIA
jgi:hypothetical protein